MGGRATYADGGSPTGIPTDEMAMSDRDQRAVRYRELFGADPDASFMDRTGQSLRHNAPHLMLGLGAVGARGATVAPPSPYATPEAIRAQVRAVIEQGQPRAAPSQRPSHVPADEWSQWTPIRPNEPPVTDTGYLDALFGGRSTSLAGQPQRGARPSGGDMDLNYMRGLREFYRQQEPTGPLHADGGPVIARADGGVVSGPIVGTTGGREDAKPVSVRSGSYVLPADTVAALGEGNSLKGLEVLSARFGGVVTARAMGGPAQDVDILISDGEFVVTPEHVAELGRGDLEAGHRALDAFVKQTRAQQISTLKGLPAPAKD